MSNMKIISLVDASARETAAKAEADIHGLILAIDAQLDVLERQLERKLEQITQRLVKLEEGDGGPVK
jgi:ribosome-associated translation inhibitor RaiA